MIDDEEYGGQTIIEQEQAMVLPKGYVGIELETFEAFTAMVQRVVILKERILSGEKLTKDQLLRALGAFDEAEAELIGNNFEKKRRRDERH